jgi:hypothetical protein
MMAVLNHPDFIDQQIGIVFADMINVIDSFLCDLVSWWL